MHVEIIFLSLFVGTVVEAFRFILQRELLFCNITNWFVTYYFEPFPCFWTGHCELFPPECYSSLKHTDTYKVTSVCLFQHVIFLSSTLQSEWRSDLRAGVGHAHLSPSMCHCVTITFHHATVRRQNCFQKKGPTRNNQKIQVIKTGSIRTFWGKPSGILSYKKD